MTTTDNEKLNLQASNKPTTTLVSIFALLKQYGASFTHLHATFNSMHVPTAGVNTLDGFTR